MEEEYPGPEDLFTTDEVYQILALVNEALSGVQFHYWVNKAQGQHFEVLDWIELQFESGKKMFLTAGLDSDGIKLGDPDFELIRANLRDEFKGVVSLDSRDVSGHDFWSGNLGKPITPSLIKHEKGMLNDSIVLKFEEGDDIEITLGLEGLEVDYFEGDD
jgi:hypothetical protein